VLFSYFIFKGDRKTKHKKGRKIRGAWIKCVPIKEGEHVMIVNDQE